MVADSIPVCISPSHKKPAADVTCGCEFICAISSFRTYIGVTVSSSLPVTPSIGVTSDAGGSLLASYGLGDSNLTGVLYCTMFLDRMKSLEKRVKRM